MKLTYKKPDLDVRSSYWDNIKGILILLVVFGHCMLGVRHLFIAETLMEIIYIFHMPAFIFVSGFFGKSTKSSSPQSIFKLIFAYLIFNTSMCVIYGCDSLLEPMYSYWYLIALIVWRIATPYIAPYRDTLLLSIAVSLFVGLFPSVDNTFAVSRILAFYPFYIYGYKLNKKDSEKYIINKNIKTIFLGILAFMVFGSIATAEITIRSVSDSKLQMFSYDSPSDMIDRMALIFGAFAMIFAMRIFTSDKKIPLLTMIGRNSLPIYLFHRPLTLIYADHIGKLPSWAVILSGAVLSVLICLVFGNDLFSYYFGRFLDASSELFIDKKNGDIRSRKAVKLVSVLVCVGFIGRYIFDYYSSVMYGQDDENTGAESTVSSEMYSPMSFEKQTEFDNAFRIAFTGDLILLEDQVKRANKNGKYDFSDMFEYTKQYISSADLAIGVLEGPLVDGSEGYSTSNFDDNKSLSLGFPDEFAREIYDTGYDIVSTANNHFLDRGVENSVRTLDVLDGIGLEHIGSYRDAEDKERNSIKIIEKDGIRFAVLAYTYGSNGYDTDSLCNGGRYEALTSVICDSSGERFEMLRRSVADDFEKAKSQGADIIIVLPHIGTQFENTADEEQNAWFEVFRSCGADIILGDHSHSVQPVSVRDYDGHSVYELYCPGNYANIYREHGGDTSAIAEVYIDKNTKKIIGGSVIPLYTQASADGNFRALPYYSVCTDEKLRSQLSTDDVLKAENAYRTVSECMLGISADIVSERYYFDESGYLRTRTDMPELTDEMKQSVLYKAIEENDSVCFVGDSITEGTRNGGCPWYEPLTYCFKDKSIKNFSLGGSTVSYLCNNSDMIPEADLYVIATGTNDVRYRDESVCAMTADDYIGRISELKNSLAGKHPDAKFVFIAPWYSTDGDIYCTLSFDAKTELNNEYSEALGKWCESENVGYIDPNPYIKSRIDEKYTGYYLVDHIHPNSTRGVVMYCEAVMLSETNSIK